MYKVLVVLVVFAIASLAKGEYFAGKYDNIDVDKILANRRLAKGFYDCLMDQGTCSPDAADLKSVMSDALKTDCASCSDKQKEAVKKVIHHLDRNEKEWFQALIAKYDPDGLYKKHYQPLAEKEGIKL